MDHLQTVNQLMEKVQEFNIKIYVALVDYNKAFDSVEHDYILQALSQQGIEPKYIRLLDTLYKGSTAKVKTETEGKVFPLEKGVKQGDPISPKLFSSLLEHQFRKLKWDSRYGISIDGIRLTHLRFADDILLVATSAKELQSMLMELDRVSAEAGLTMNSNKTKVMTNAVEEQIKVNGKDLEYVKEYIYLGQTISFSNQSTTEIKRRINLAWKKYWSLKFILEDKFQKHSLKKEVIETCVLPVLLYGCQTWALTKKQTTMLQVCQRKMERKILHVTRMDRMTNEEVRRKTGMIDAASRAQQLKWKWGGHVARMQHHRWTQRTTMWDPRIGRRTAGRPKMRWADDFQKAAGTKWSTQARNRASWRALERAATQM